jgi:hypothetical protein
MCRLEDNIKMDIKELGREAELLATENQSNSKWNLFQPLVFHVELQKATATERQVVQWKGCI